MTRYEIKINGVWDIDCPINKDKIYSIALESIGNKDGITQTRVDKNDQEVVKYTMENLGKCTLIEEGEKVIKGTSKKTSKSQIWRLIVEKEDSYDLVMDKMINHAEEVLRFINSL